MKAKGHTLCVTGSSGWIGSVFVQHYLDNAALFEENAGDWFEPISDVEKINQFDIQEGQDLLNEKDVCEGLNGVDTLVHIAGVPSPGHGSDFERYFDANVRGTLNIVQQAVRQGVERIVYASSTAYYGLDADLPFEFPIREENKIVTQLAAEQSLTGPMQFSRNAMAYGTSKVMAEQVLANYGMTGMIDVVILRIAPVGMPVPHLGTAHVTLKKTIKAFDVSVSKERVPSYSAYTVANNTEGVDLTRAKRFFGF